MVIIQDCVYNSYTQKKLVDNFLIMSEGNIFPNNPIKSETFKVALICEKGIITQLKMIDKFGVESYKRTRGNYVPVNKKFNNWCIPR